MVRGRIEVISELCKGCGYCIKFCPKKLIGLSSDVNSKGYEYAEQKKEGCVACCSCARMCPAGAINVYRVSGEE